MTDTPGAEPRARIRGKVATFTAKLRPGPRVASSVASAVQNQRALYPWLAYGVLVLIGLTLPGVWLAVLAFLGVIFLTPVIAWWRLKGKAHRHSRRAALSWMITGSDRKVGNTPLWRFAIFRCALPATVWLLAWNTASNGSAADQVTAYAFTLLLLGPAVTVLGWGRPWWKELRYRQGRNPVYDGSLVGPSPGTGSKERRNQLDALGADYQRAVEALNLPPSSVKGSANDGYAETMTLECVPGASLTGSEGKLASWVASRYAIAPGDVEVSPNKGNGRRWTVRAQYADALGVTKRAPDVIWHTPDTLTIGVFRDGDPIRLAAFWHTLIGGATGGGKSTLLNLLLRAYAINNGVAIVGIDLASQFERWRRDMVACATTAEDADALLDALHDIMAARERTLAAEDQDNWTLKLGPFLIVAIDELPSLLGLKHAVPKFHRLMERGRKLGVIVFAAAQNPTNDNMGGSGSSRSQFEQIISLKMNRPENSAGIFGQDLAREGYKPNLIPSGEQHRGKCYAVGPRINKSGPVMGRTFLISREQRNSGGTMPALDETLADLGMPTEAVVEGPAEAALREIGRPATLKEVAETSGLSASKARRALAGSRLVEDAGTTGQGNAKLYRLVKDA